MNDSIVSVEMSIQQDEKFYPCRSQKLTLVSEGIIEIKLL
jgi:hypothetical protein